MGTSREDSESRSSPSTPREGSRNRSGAVTALETTAGEANDHAPADRLRLALARASHRLVAGWRTWWTTARHYESSIVPFERVDLPPSKLTHVLTATGREQVTADVPARSSGVVGGSWDRETVPFPATPGYQRVRRVIQSAGKDVDGGVFEGADHPTDAPTPRVGRPADGPEAGLGEDHPVVEASVASALEYAIADIAARGYRSVRTRRGERSPSVEPVEPSISDPAPQVPPSMAEVRVHIGRQGRYLLHRGSERVAIAQALGVTQMPVSIWCRHEHWQQVRERVELLETVSQQYSDHEDLR